MSRRRPTPLEELVEPGVRVPRIEPLQARIAKNRWRFVGFVISFTTSIALAVAITAGLIAVFVAGAILLRFNPYLWSTPAEVGRFIGGVTTRSFAVALIITWGWSIIRLLRSDLALLDKLGARMAKAGSFLQTRSALHDVSLAAGLDRVPGLYVLDTSRVNAFVLGRSPSNVRIGVTQGLLDRISVGDQRAVFANLIARVVVRDTLWATAVSALIGPISAHRDFDLRRGTVDYGEPHTTPPPKEQRTNAADPRGAFFIVYSVAVILTEVLSWYSREAVWRMAEKADAEGMLLLKDPRAMLHAMEHVLDRDNHVPVAGDAYSPLFYCWAGFGFAPEDDPEMRRVARLREALGAEGAAYVPRPNVPDWSNPPMAPRIEQLQEIQRQRADRERPAS